MKKLILLFTAFSFVIHSFAAFTLPASTPKKDPPKASEVYIPVGKNGEKISLMELALIKPKELQELTGKKMKFFDRIGFKVAQKGLRNSINNDGTFNEKKLKKFFSKAVDGSSGFHLGGFALGFLLGLIGVLIAYLIKDDYKSNRVKWAWIGWGIWLVIFLIAVLA